MRTIKTTTGRRVALDGDLLAVMETLSREVTRRRDARVGFEDMDREIQHLVEQMTDDERRELPGGEPVHELQPVRERAADARSCGKPKQASGTRRERVSGRAASAD